MKRTKEKHPFRPASRQSRRPFSPVITADVKLFGELRFLCVDVRFRSVAELDKLIAALMALRESASDSRDHVHLQDSNTGALRRTGTEVTFHRPGLAHDSGDRSCIRTALRQIDSFKAIASDTV